MKLLALAVLLVSCAPATPARLPESCVKPCEYPYSYPAGPDASGECYCEAPHEEQDPADAFLTH